jgi:hypothetical protein
MAAGGVTVYGCCESFQRRQVAKLGGLHHLCKIAISASVIERFSVTSKITGSSGALTDRP